MRALTLTAGILGFAVIAMGSEGVVVTAPARTWSAEYVYGPGTADESVQHVSVTRQFKFYYADAKIDGQDPKALAPNSDDNIREYLESDVSQAIEQASQEAAKKGKKPQDLVQKYLDQLRFKTVDCRLVTRKMVETLVGNRVKDVKALDGSYSLQYLRNEDDMDVAMTARALDAITIMRDPSIGANDNEPRFTCRETAVSGTPAKCGDLRIKFNPLEAQAGVFKGKRAVVFNPDTCSKYSNMEFNACELLVQIQRCGLRYTEKADGRRSGSPSTRGLADFLEETRNMALHARQRGDNDSVAQPEAAEGSAGSASFYDDFKAPSDPGSRRPAR